ncbi:MAG: thiamine diphosphokinase [Lachnospiraceae bacterium]|nr:thiamine diphosphokinase [Lachnospiraceae bacterium]
MKTGIIVGAAPLGKETELLKRLLLTNDDEHAVETGCPCKTNDIYVVAADGGIEFFMKEGIKPDHWIGDMDSVTTELKGVVSNQFPDLKINSCSPIKDVTDMEIGIEDAILNDCENIYLFGGLGGQRTSHTIANIQLICHYKNKGINVKLFGEGKTAFVIKGGEVKKYTKSDKGFVSVLALSDIAKGVKIKGLFYEYEGDLSNTYALGVSNELTGKPASVSLDEGILLIIEETK